MNNEVKFTIRTDYLFVVFIVFLILKLAHVIAWSWWLVTLPLWIIVPVFGVVALSLGVKHAVLSWLWVFTLVFGYILAYPILWWERGQNKRIAAVYAAREQLTVDPIDARAASMANHPAGKARSSVNLTK